MLLLDDYAYRSRWRSVHPAEKLLLCGAGLLASLISHHVEVVWTLFALQIFWNCIAHGHPFQLFPRLLLVPLVFVLPSTLILALTFQSAASTKDILWSHHLLGNVFLCITHTTALQALLILGKSLSAYSSLLFLILSTPVVELTSFMRRMGLPNTATELVVLTYRMIGVFVGTAETIRRSQSARCGWRNFRCAFRSAGFLIMNLFSRALFYTQRLSAALESRGYQGTLRVIHPVSPICPLRACGLGAIALAVLISVSWLEWGHSHL